MKKKFPYANHPMWLTQLATGERTETDSDTVLGMVLPEKVDEWREAFQYLNRNDQFNEAIVDWFIHRETLSWYRVNIRWVP